MIIIGFKIQKSNIYKLLTLLCCVFSLYALYQSFTMYLRSSFLIDLINPSIFLLIVILHEFFFGKYILEDRNLKISLGIRRKNIYLANILSIKKVSKTFVPLGTDYSLWKSKIKINYFDNRGYEREVYISPEDEDLFLEKLYSKVSFSEDIIVENK